MSLDTDIENVVAAIVSAAIPNVPCDARKILALAEGEEVPRIMVRCGYDRAEAGDSDYPINGIYLLTIRMLTRNNKLKTGDETLKDWRQTIMKLLYGPTLAGVDAVSDIRTIRPRIVNRPQVPPGVDSEFIQFEVETFEVLS